MKTIDRDIILNWWLEKYHNTNVEEVVKNHPKEVLESPEWFKLYPVTKEQYDEWKVWAKSYIKKELKLPNTLVDRRFWSIDLDCSPYYKLTNE